MAPRIAGLCPQEELGISARFGECLEIREFVTPATLSVRELAAELAASSPYEDDFILACWGWVAANIRYPRSDRRELRFAGRRLVSQDYWSLPAEVLAPTQRVEDCDGASFALASLLRHRLGPAQVYVVLGELARGRPGDFGHAWVEVQRMGRWYLLEATLDRLPEPPWVQAEAAPEYQPALFFNDVEVWTSPRPIRFPFGRCDVPWLQDYLCTKCKGGT